MTDSKNQALMIKSNKLYDMLKQITQITLPAVATLYFALSQIWGLPNGAEVVGTITAVDAFLGVLLHVSSSSYNNSDERFDGSIDVHEDDKSKRYELNLNDDPEKLDDKDQVVFKVKKKKLPK